VNDAEMVGRSLSRGRGKWVATVAALLVVGGPAVWYAASGMETRALDARERERLGGTYAALSRGVTHYELTGPPGGRTVVLIHGATIPMWDWDLQVDALREAGLRVLRYDQYGRGWSDRPEAVYDRALYREQLGELLDALGIDGPVDLVGHSLGGATAVGFAVERPGLVGRIALIDPVVDSVRDRTPFEVARIPVIGALSTRTVTMRVLRSRMADLFACTGVRAGRYRQLYAEQMEIEGFERSLLSMFRSDMVGDHRDSYRAVGALGKDVMLVWGSEDEDIPREHVDFVREAVPGIEFHEMAGVGHSPNIEEPGSLNRMLVDFMSESR